MIYFTGNFALGVIQNALYEESPSQTMYACASEPKQVSRSSYTYSQI